MTLAAYDARRYSNDAEHDIADELPAPSIFPGWS
jgi:hypothetical protein